MSIIKTSVTIEVEHSNEYSRGRRSVLDICCNFSDRDSFLSGVGLGNFDGLHTGHMALINTLINECKLKQYNSIIYTFSKHPEHIFRKKLLTPLIITNEHKTDILRDTSLNYLCFEEFDEEYSRIEAEDFVKNILVDKLHAKLVVVGFNYRFGYKGRGNPQLLKALGKKYGFKVIEIPPVKVGDEIVSSTLIRKYISEGNASKVFQLMGRHFSVPGNVVKGKQIGGELGFPTANIIPEPYLVMPRTGVYITRTMIDNCWYNSITNVGKCPTVKNQNFINLETHIIDFNSNIYGQKIEVFFMEKLRNEIKFNSKDTLVEQIKKDVIVAKEYFRD